MKLNSLREAEAQRPVDGYFARATLPLRISDELAEAAFVAPLSDTLDRLGIGRVVGYELALDEQGEPVRLHIQLSLVTDAPRVLQAVADALDKLDAPAGSYIGNAECVDLVSFGHSQGLGLYLPRADTREEDRTAVVEACRDALGQAGLYQGSVSVGDRTALYFYGDSFNRMKSAITYVITTDPRCRNAFARRLN
ncbi:MAG: hypothetical protein AAF771_15345 [Pseudomonadota bacterium]